MKNKITVLLFKSENEWTISSFAGASVIAKTFGKSKAAREYAKQNGWSVRRAADCDA